MVEPRMLTWQVNEERDCNVKPQFFRRRVKTEKKIPPATPKMSVTKFFSESFSLYLLYLSFYIMNVICSKINISTVQSFTTGGRSQIKVFQVICILSITHITHLSQVFSYVKSVRPTLSILKQKIIEFSFQYKSLQISHLECDNPLSPSSFLLFWIEGKKILNKTQSLVVIITLCPAGETFFPSIKDFNIPFWSNVRD